MKMVLAVVVLLLVLLVIALTAGSATDLLVNGGTIQEFRFEGVQICPYTETSDVGSEAIELTPEFGQ